MNEVQSVSSLSDDSENDSTPEQHVKQPRNIEAYKVRGEVKDCNRIDLTEKNHLELSEPENERDVVFVDNDDGNPISKVYTLLQLQPGQF